MQTEGSKENTKPPHLFYLPASLKEFILKDPIKKAPMKEHLSVHNFFISYFRHTSSGITEKCFKHQEKL